MRITIDASAMLPPRTGVGNYVYHLVRNLLELDQNNRYTLFLNSLRRPTPDEEWLRPRPRMRLRRCRIPGAWLHRAWRRMHWPPLEVFTGPSDIIHAPAAILPPASQARRVITIHDCYFMRRPDLAHAMGGRYMRATLPGRARLADAVICVSDFTRREAIECLQLDPAKTHVVHHGVDPETFHPIRDGDPALENVRRRLNLPSQFVLSVATLEPRKNLESLLRAMALLRDRMQDPPKLVCVGGQGFRTSAIYKTYRELKLANDVFFTGYVPDTDLPGLYNLALALVEPSLYEGFGLPVLEAMACGTPVIASQVEALREIAGEAAVFFPPTAADTLAEAIRAMAESPAHRLEYARRGLDHAREFSWRDTARKTLAVYERICDQSD